MLDKRGPAHYSKGNLCLTGTTVPIGRGNVKKEEERRMAQAYCVKCRKKVDIKDPQKVTLKNKRPATSGTCPTCGTKVFRIEKS